jgi:general secretion pathway protein A
MYLSFFGLAEAPFSIAPTPRYLYMSQRHQEALAHLLYGVNSGGGFVLLTGEVGAGKTTVCRALLEQIPETCDVAYIFNPRLTVEELLEAVCVEFGITCPAGNRSIKVFVDCLNAHLLAAHAHGRQAVLIIDEAQNLSADVLEQMRLLTNLETSEHKLLQIILIGQPELATVLERPELKQLAQRIVARYHLGPLTRDEVAAYVRHRLEVAGCQRPLFPTALTSRLHRASGGVPRILNLLCDRALLGAYVQGKERVDRKTLKQAEHEVLQTPTQQRRQQRLQQLSIGLTTAAIAGLLAWIYWPVGESLIDVAPAKPAIAQMAAATTTQMPPAVASIAAPNEADSETPAYTALFKVWDATYRSGDVCRQAEAQGLRCRNARGSLVELRQLNWPAVLTLRDEQGRNFAATLIALDRRKASLVVGQQRIDADLGTLASQWNGEYSLLWRLPTAVETTLRPDDEGPGIVWLRESMAMIDGQAPAVNQPTRYDQALAQRVRKFQQASGLKADGNVGAQTLMHLLAGLDVKADTTAPSLSSEAGAQ